MDRYRKNESAVSPVIATILMVAITVVLAGVLVVYLQTINVDSGVKPETIGVRLERTDEGNWTMRIVQGETALSGIVVQVTNPSTGSVVVGGSLTAISPYYSLRDNSLPGHLNAGDVVLFNQTANFVQEGYTVSLIKGGGTLVAPTVLR